MSAGPTTNPFFGLSGIRALACIGIIFYHLNQQRSITNLSTWNWDLYQFVATFNSLVSLFFILTGAGISLKFWSTIFYDAPVPPARLLFLERLGRIAPAYWVVLIVTF